MQDEVTIQTDNKSFKRRDNSNIGKTLTNQNSIQEEITSRLKLGKACYDSVLVLFIFQFAIRNYKD